MRVTRQGLLELALRSTTEQRTELQRVQTQATTGIRFTRASEDVVAATAAQRASETVDDQGIAIANAERAIDTFDAADSALTAVADILVRAREIAVAMASETNDAAARAGASIEVTALVSRLQAAANQEMDGRYLFAGAAWDTPPFALDGTYSGSTQEPEAVIGAEARVRTAFDGSAIFNGAVDVFGVLSDLGVALDANDADAVAATLDTLDAATVAVSSTRADIAVETTTTEAALYVAEATEVLASQRLSALVDTDPIATYTRMSQLQAGYESTLQVIASSATRSLFDLLGR